MFNYLDPNIENFHHLLQTGYCLFVTGLLFALWRFFYKLEVYKLKDPVYKPNSLFFMMIATFAWALAGGWMLMEVHITNWFGDYVYVGGTLVWSGINNVSILLILPYFNNRLPLFKEGSYFNVNYRIFCSAVFLTPIVCSMGLLYYIKDPRIDWTSLPDTVVSIIVLGLLIWAIWNSFYVQNIFLRIIAILSIAVLVTVSFSQVYLLSFPNFFDISPELNNFFLLLTLLISKIAMITIFMVIVISFVTDLFEEKRTEVKESKEQFEQVQVEKEEALEEAKEQLEEVIRLEEKYQKRSMTIRKFKKNVFITFMFPERTDVENEEEYKLKRSQKLWEILERLIEDRIERGTDAWLDFEELGYEQSSGLTNIFNRLIKDLKIERSFLIRTKTRKEVMGKGKRINKRNVYQIRIAPDQIFNTE